MSDLAKKFGIGEREIKFRFWDYRFKKMDIGGGDCLLRQNSDDHSGIMQFTGLLDKHGKEIYEADVVNGMVARIVGGHAVFQFECKDGIHRYPWHNYPMVPGEFQYLELEIQGNLFENPELLKQS